MFLIKQMKKMSQILITGFTILSCIIILCILINWLFYSWTDHLYLTSCSGKKADTCREIHQENVSWIECHNKLDYFTQIKISYGQLYKHSFSQGLFNDSQYEIKRLQDKEDDPLIISKKIDNQTYQINFAYVWRDWKGTKVYDGVGVRYSVEAPCGTPAFRIKRNLKSIISDLPLPNELKEEMLNKFDITVKTSTAPMRLW